MPPCRRSTRLALFAERELGQSAIRVLDHDVTVNKLRCQRLTKGRVLFRRVVEREHVDIEEKIVAKEGIFDLLEQGADAEFARPQWPSRFSMGKQ